MSDPKTLGAKVDAFYKARRARLDLDAKVEEMKARESEMKEEILRLLTADKLEGAKGKLATVAITTTEFPQITDLSKLHAHILKTGDFDLLEKRASRSGCAARWEEGEEVPGVERMTRVDLSFTKSTR